MFLQNKSLILSIIIALQFCLFCNCQTGSGSIIVNSFQITWVNRGPQTDFTVTIPASIVSAYPNNWFGIGFNSAPRMNGANVVICKNTRVNPTVEHFYTVANSPMLLNIANPSLGISNGRIQASGTNLLCLFTRDNTNPIANYFALTPGVNFNFIVASGDLLQLPSNAFVPQFHGNGNSATSVTVTFPSPVIAAVPTTTVVPTTTALEQNYKLGEIRLGSFVLKWNDTMNSTDFEFIVVLNRQTSMWAGFGFSYDRSMGGDDMNVCITTGGAISFRRYWTTGPTSAEILAPQNATIGTSRFIGSVYNDIMTCSFSRAKLLPGFDRHYDTFTRDFYFVFASGPVAANGAIEPNTVSIFTVNTFRFLGPQPAQQTTVPITAAQTTTTRRTLVVATPTFRLLNVLGLLETLCKEVTECLKKLFG